MPSTTRVLPDLWAGQTYSFDLDELRDGDGQPLDVTGFIYILTAKRDLDLDDAQATGEQGFQVRITATADDSAAGFVPIDVPSAITAPLKGSYHIELIEIQPGSPDRVTPIIESQRIVARRGPTRNLA